MRAAPFLICKDIIPDVRKGFSSNSAALPSVAVPFQQYPMVDVIEEAFYISFDHKP